MPVEKLLNRPGMGRGRIGRCNRLLQREEIFRVRNHKTIVRIRYDVGGFASGGLEPDRHAERLGVGRVIRNHWIWAAIGKANDNRNRTPLKMRRSRNRRCLFGCRERSLTNDAFGVNRAVTRMISRNLKHDFGDFMTQIFSGFFRPTGLRDNRDQCNESGSHIVTLHVQRAPQHPEMEGFTGTTIVVACLRLVDWTALQHRRNRKSIRYATIKSNSMSLSPRFFFIFFLFLAAASNAANHRFSSVLVSPRLTTNKPRATSDSTFTLFESGSVRPLALSADGSLLFAANTPADRLEIFSISGPSAQTISLVASVPVGLEPVAVALRSPTEVWVVNHLSDSVSVVDIGNLQTARVVRTLLVGDEPRD